MVWRRNAIVLGICAQLAAPDLSAAELVVMESIGAVYKVGQTLSQDAALDLKAGQSLTLMTMAGKMIKLAGPAQSIPGDGAKGDGGKADDKAVLSALAGMVKGRNADTGSLGTFRSAGAELPDPWLLDVSGSGHRCVLDGQPVVLWRPDSDGDQPVVLSIEGQPGTARAVWPAGAQRLYGPEGLDLADGRVLVVDLNGRQARLSLHAVPAGLANDAMRLGWLDQKECRDQAMALVRQVE